MEEPCRAFDTKPSTTALESEPVSETDVSHGKHQTDPIQGKSSKADEHGPGPSGLRSLGKKQVEENDTVESPAEGDEEPGIGTEPNRKGDTRRGPAHSATESGCTSAELRDSG